MPSSTMQMAMSLSAWRGLCAFLLLVIFMQFYLILSHDRGTPYHTAAPPRVIPAPHRPSAGEWAFDVERDAGNNALSSEQCDAAFPDLYYEIDRSVNWWKDHKHTITPEDVSIDWRRDAAMRVLVHNNQVRVLQAKGIMPKGYHDRAIPMLSQLHRALLGASAAGETLPDIEFSVTVDDMALIPGEKGDTHAIWAFTRNRHDRAHDREWIMPDFNFWASQGNAFYDMELRAQAHDKPFSEKVPKAVWRGAKWTNVPIRGNLLDKTEGKDWADVKEMEWKTKENFMRMEDLCRYAFPVHTEGRSWSGRLKYIFNCNSVPVVHKLDWMAHLYHLLVPDGPDQNYLPVERDFSDLEKKIKHLLGHPDEAQRIADNAVKTFRSRYTTMAAESCYWRQMVRGWSEVAFTPEVYENVTAEIGAEAFEETVVRGRTYEGIILADEKEIQDWIHKQQEAKEKAEKEQEGT